MNPSTEFKAIVSGLVLLFVICMTWVESARYNEPTPAPQAATPLIRLGHGNDQAANTGSGVPLKPATATPAGYHPVATAHLDTAPQSVVYHADSPASGAASGSDLPLTQAPPPPAGCDSYISHLQCAAVHIDLSIVRNDKGQYQAVARDASGQELNSFTFNPGDLGMVPKAHPWLLGPTYGTGAAGGWGVAAAYQFHALPVAIGAEIFKAPAGGLEPRAMILIPL